jgi:hypothetical protein
MGNRTEALIRNIEEEEVEEEEEEEEESLLKCIVLSFGI